MSGLDEVDVERLIAGVKREVCLLLQGPTLLKTREQVLAEAEAAISRAASAVRAEASNFRLVGDKVLFDFTPPPAPRHVSLDFAVFADVQAEPRVARLSVRNITTGLYRAGSPEAEAIKAGIETLHARRARMEAAEALRRAEHHAAQVLARAQGTEKTGPRPWPEGTEFVFVVRRYRSGVHRVQRTPMVEATKRTVLRDMFADRGAAEERAVYLSSFAAEAARGAARRAQDRVVEADRADFLTQEAISRRPGSCVRITPTPPRPAPLALTDAEAEAAGQES